MLMKSKNFERRDILKIGLAGFLSAVTPLFSIQTANAASKFQAWRVSFRHGHTGESFSGVYRVGDRYLPEAFERLNYVLRDFRTKESFPMDPRTIDIMSMVQSKTNMNKPLEILSGYRSPKTNNMLSNVSTGVAKNSFHMYGQAIDMRLPGYKTSALRNIAKSLKAGGVGYYPKSDFIHVDTGEVRYWQ